MSRHRDFKNFPISDISGSLLWGIRSSKKKGDVKVPLISEDGGGA